MCMVHVGKILKNIRINLNRIFKSPLLFLYCPTLGKAIMQLAVDAMLLD